GGAFVPRPESPRQGGSHFAVECGSVLPLLECAVKGAYSPVNESAGAPAHSKAPTSGRASAPPRADKPGAVHRASIPPAPGRQDRSSRRVKPAPSAGRRFGQKRDPTNPRPPGV